MPIALLDINLELLHANAAFGSLIDSGTDGIAGASFYGLVHPDDRASLRPGTELARSETAVVDLRLIRTDQSTQYTRIRFSIFSFAGSSYIQAAAEDRTGRSDNEPGHDRQHPLASYEGRTWTQDEIIDAAGRIASKYNGVKIAWVGVGNSYTAVYGPQGPGLASRPVSDPGGPMDALPDLALSSSTVLARCDSTPSFAGNPEGSFDAAPTASTLSPPGVENFSDIQLQILVRLLRGERVPGIAKALFFSQGTVRNNLVSMFRKLGVHSQAEMLEIIRQGASDHVA